MKQASALNFDNVIKIAQETKIAMFDEWAKSGEKFVDKNYMRSEGLIPQSIGVASALLLLVVFGDNKDVFPENEKAEIDRKVSKMIGVMLDMVDREGYSITPYKKAEQTKELFGTYGYTDVMTWVSSSCILARYAQRKGVVTIEDALRDRLLHIGADAFKKLLEGQREDGTWGFRADAGKPSKGSLYFTYAVNAALADFFNYALGEIDEVEKNNDSELLGGGRDDNFINYLNDKGGFTDVVESVKEARRKVQNWLIKNCLPLLPKVASCEELSDEEKKILAIGKKKNSSDFKLNYFNLYHTYYLIDMFIDGAADLRYEKIVNNEADFKELLAHYETGGVAGGMCLPEDDLHYYFKDNNGENAINFCKEYIAQAIHASRVNYMNASRTRYGFWIGNSEFELEWDYEEEDHEMRQLVARAKVDIKEPALVPMALRINVQYCYFVSEQPDKTVDDMFGKIIGDRHVGETNDECTNNLWDNEGYNILITERSIEALIDAYDYVCKYQAEEENVSSESAKVGVLEEYVQKLVDERVKQALKEKSTDDLSSLIEEGVKKQLESLDISALVNEEVEKRMAGVSVASESQAGGGISEEEIINKIRAIAKFVKDETPNAKGELPYERISYELLRLFMEMNGCMNRVTVAQQLFLAGERRRDGNELFTLEDDRLFRKYTDDASNKLQDFETVYPNFFYSLIEDVDENDKSYLLGLYGVLKDLLNQQK